MDPFSEVTDEQRSRAEAIMACLHGSFIDAVKERRQGKLQLEEPSDLFSGAPPPRLASPVLRTRRCFTRARGLRAEPASSTTLTGVRVERVLPPIVVAAAAARRAR